MKLATSNCKNSASPSSRGRLLYIHPVGRRLSRFVTINSTSIEPSMKVRNLTSVHHIILRASSVHHQCINIASSVHHKCIISASSVHHQHIISASLAHHQHTVSTSSAHHVHIIYTQSFALFTMSSFLRGAFDFGL